MTQLAALLSAITLGDGTARSSASGHLAARHGTVCDNTVGEVCPIFPSKTIKAHWGVPDPAHFQGTPSEIETEFDRVFFILNRRVKAFLDLPLEQMGKGDLQQKLNEIVLVKLYRIEIVKHQLNEVVKLLFYK